MQNNNCVFLVGGPGSGKDFILHTALKESTAVELPLPKLVDAILNNKNLEEVNGQPLIINGKADNPRVGISKTVLEAMGYQTAMIFVYTDNEASFLRSKIIESRRSAQYDESLRMMHTYKDLFGEGFFLFDNSNDYKTVNEETQGQIVAWLTELAESMEDHFRKQLIKTTPHVPGPKTPHPVPKGMKRIKDGSFNKLVSVDDHRYKNHPTVEETETDVDTLFEQEFDEARATIVDMEVKKNDKKQGDKYKGGISIPGDKATSREVVEGAQKHMITFSHMTSGYRIHKIGCPSATQNDRRNAWVHHGDAHHAEAWCRADEEEKGGDPAKADVKICKCAKGMHECIEEDSNQEVVVTQAQKKGVKYSKDRPAKGMKPPGDTFDSRMGSVPSGGIGLTAYHVDETQPTPGKKTLREMRKK